jgi:hypothetical protein
VWHINNGEATADISSWHINNAETTVHISLRHINNGETTVDISLWDTNNGETKVDISLWDINNGETTVDHSYICDTLICSPVIFHHVSAFKAINRRYKYLKAISYNTKVHEKET